jgi:hypothetical protein
VKKGDKVQEEARLRNARVVARRLISNAVALRDARVQMEFNRITIATMQEEIAHLRGALKTALLKFYAPDLDGSEMPGDLPVADLAGIALECGLRVRPRLEPIEKSQEPTP